MLKYEITSPKSAQAFLEGTHLGKDEIARLFRERLFLLNGSPLAPEDKLLPGMNVVISLPAEWASKMPSPFPRAITVLYRDQDLVVCVKPSGLVIHDEAVPETLLSALSWTLIQDKEAGDLFPIQRLDRDTQGLITFARNRLAAADLSWQIEHGEVKKTYQALVHGKFREKAGTIALPIGHDRHASNRYLVLKNGKEAVTHYEVLTATNERSLVKAVIETGRTHQIRVHFAHLGHPVYGDVIYGKADASYLRLIATEVRFTHPGNGKAMHFTLSLPEGFTRPEKDTPNA